MKRILICLILTACVTGAVYSQDVSVRSDHPDEYTVQQGDTLWDISGRFLDYPWQWPAIWHANQQIENPHLIYPGDVISLVYLDGQPRLMVDRGQRMVKLSPEARVTNRSAITAVPHDQMAGFLRNVRLVSAEEFETLPYVVANNEDRHYSTNTDFTYARGVSGSPGDRFAIMRLAHIYFEGKDGIRVGRDPGHGNKFPINKTYRLNQRFRFYHRGEVIGVELFEVGQAELAKTGDPAVLEVVTGLDVVAEGDVVVPLDTIGYPEYYMPRAMDAVPGDLKVLAVQGDNRLVGHQKIVSISGGKRQGIEPGHVFSSFRAGKLVRDDVKYPKESWADATAWSSDKVVLPDEFNGHIMVFRVFDDVSYALVMEGPRVVRVDDLLKHPDETL